MSDETEAAREAAEQDFPRDETYRERHGDEPVHDCDGTCPDCQSARHCEIRIDGLPGQLRQGTYAVYFTGMEYGPGIDRPILRFRYSGVYPQQQAPGLKAQAREILKEGEAGIPEPERTGTPRMAEQAEAEGWLLPPPELPEVYRTRSGKIITEAMIEGWVAEAEAGYDPDKIRERMSGIQILQGAAYKSAQRLSRDLGTGPPDLMMVSQVEVLNVTKMAHVIAALVNTGVIDRETIGMQMRGHLNPADVETWLRS